MTSELQTLCTVCVLTYVTDYRAHLHYSARVIQAVYRNYRCRQLASRNIQSVIAIQVTPEMRRKGV